MTAWLHAWNTRPQACEQYESWGNCFMRLANSGAPGIDCLSTYSGEESCHALVWGRCVGG